MEERTISSLRGAINRGREERIPTQTITERQHPLHVTKDGTIIDLLQINLNGPANLEWKLVTIEGITSGNKAIGEHSRVVIVASSPAHETQLPLLIEGNEEEERKVIRADDSTVPKK